MFSIFISMLYLGLYTHTHTPFGHICSSQTELLLFGLVYFQVIRGQVHHWALSTRENLALGSSLARQDPNLPLVLLKVLSLPMLTGNSDHVRAGFVNAEAQGAPWTSLMSALCIPSFLAKVATAEECLVNTVGMNRYSMDASSTAFSHRGSVTHSSSLYKRLNCGDSHLSGGPATTTSGPRTNPVPSGSSSTPGLRLPASSPKRNGTAVEGNRCGNAMRTLGPGNTAQGSG